MTPSSPASVDLTVVLIVALKVVLVFVFLLVATMLMVWFERKVVGDIQNRVGPNPAGPFGILQTLADGTKFFFKEDLIPDKAERRVFILAPLLSVVPAFLLFSIVPFGGDFSNGGNGTVEIFGQRDATPARRPSDRHPLRPGHVLDRRLRRHARRLVVRLEVPAARFRAGLGPDGLLRGRRSAWPSSPSCS